MGQNDAPADAPNLADPEQELDPEQLDNVSGGAGGKPEEIVVVGSKTIGTDHTSASTGQLARYPLHFHLSSDSSSKD